VFSHLFGALAARFHFHYPAVKIFQVIVQPFKVGAAFFFSLA
jgi:hypothetical protein